MGWNHQIAYESTSTMECTKGCDERCEKRACFARSWGNLPLTPSRGAAEKNIGSVAMGSNFMAYEIDKAYGFWNKQTS